MPQGLRKITILHRQGVLRDYLFPTAIEAERTYEMVLEIAPSGPDPKKTVRQQYLAFQITPPNVTLEVNDQLWEVDADGNAMQYVDFGTYSYRVRAANYFTEAGMVTVNDPDNTQKVKIDLKPDYAEVTLKVDADAEIWVNGERKGVRSWTGRLGRGTYKIECKQEGYETSEVSKEITSEMSGQNVDLPVPKPLYGSLNVESTPKFCTLYIDGKAMGETPKSINEILVGHHTLKLTKDGYADYTETITIAKDERKQVKAIMTERKNHQLDIPEGAIAGKFSVSPGKQVYFSQGNLQYHASTNTWRFAENQWDCIGEDNKNISSNYNGWMDLFGWGASGYNGQYPYMTSTNSSEYGSNLGITGTSYDWGVYNKIINGGNQTGLWRTLKSREWEYLFVKRSTTSGIRYAKACVSGINGVILLPDDWESSFYSLSSTNNEKAGFNSNTITASQWTTLEQHGAVFLPAAGHRGGTAVYNPGTYGHYWSTSNENSTNAYGVYFTNANLISKVLAGRVQGQSVRLVCPVK